MSLSWFLALFLYFFRFGLLIVWVSELFPTVLDLFAFCTAFVVYCLGFPAYFLAYGLPSAFSDLECSKRTDRINQVLIIGF